jgi:hypothetical protein
MHWEGWHSDQFTSDISSEITRKETSEGLLEQWNKDITSKMITSEIPRDLTRDEGLEVLRLFTSHFTSSRFDRSPTLESL